VAAGGAIEVQAASALRDDAPQAGLLPSLENARP